MIRVLPDADALVAAAADHVVECAAGAIASRGRFLWALSGGGTPRPVYETLARPPLRDAVDWSRVDLFWGDERCVPPEDPRSNYRMTAETLLAGAPVPVGRVHRVRGEDDPAAAAADYERELLALGGGRAPEFDLVLLGMGADGHTASLFPGSPALDERGRLAVAVDGPDGLRRVTLTLPVLGRARAVAFLVSGREKAPALRRALAGGVDAPPAARVLPALGEPLWLVDAEAASGLEG